MKRGISKQITIKRTVTYNFTRDDLLKRLKLPDSALLSVTVPSDGGAPTRVILGGAVDSLDVEVQE